VVVTYVLLLLYGAETLNRSIVLLTVSEKALSLGDQARSILSFIHDFLESRLSLLRAVEVRNPQCILPSTY
jgi:hypothetical protein